MTAKKKAVERRVTRAVVGRRRQAPRPGEFTAEEVAEMRRHAERAHEEYLQAGGRPMTIDEILRALKR